MGPQEGNLNSGALNIHFVASRSPSDHVGVVRSGVGNQTPSRDDADVDRKDHTGMPERILMHVPYPFADQSRGSAVRPFQMCEAFKELGYHVEVLSGPRRERLKRVFRLFLEGKPDRLLFCYSEPSTYPLNPVVDYPFYLFLAMHRIPTGIYYRDAYWKFPTWFPHHGIKGLMLQVRYRVDWWVLNKVASVLYFPSREMTGLFSARKPKAILPPGGKVVSHRGFLSPSSRVRSAIYVGGISENLGLSLLLGAVAFVNERHPLRLHLVCKKDQFDRARLVFEKYSGADWLRVHHLAAPDLPPLYRESDFGIIPRLKDTYNDLTMPVKMFEYLSYGLPIVSTNCTEIANFIQSHQVGIVTEDNVESLAKGMLKLMRVRGLHLTLCRKVPEALERGNLWVDRAQAVAEYLTPSHSGR